MAKILYFADFRSYFMYKEPITGASYIREHGPVPESFLDILDEMESASAVEILKRRYYTTYQQRIISKHEPDLMIFSGRDIALIDEIIANQTKSSCVQNCTPCSRNTLCEDTTLPW